MYCLPYMVIVSIQEENECKSTSKYYESYTTQINTVIVGGESTTMREACLSTPSIKHQPLSVENMLPL